MSGTRESRVRLEFYVGLGVFFFLLTSLFIAFYRGFGGLESDWQSRINGIEGWSQAVFIPVFLNTIHYLFLCQIQFPTHPHPFTTSPD